MSGLQVVKWRNSWNLAEVKIFLKYMVTIIFYMSNGHFRINVTSKSKFA